MITILLPYHIQIRIGEMTYLKRTDVNSISINTNSVPDIRCQLIADVLTPVDGSAVLTRHEVRRIFPEHLVIVNQQVITRGAHVIDAEYILIIDNNIVAHQHLMFLHLIHRHIEWEGLELESSDVDSILHDTVFLSDIHNELVTVGPSTVHCDGNLNQAEIIYRITEDRNRILDQVAI